MYDFLLKLIVATRKQSLRTHTGIQRASVLFSIESFHPDRILLDAMVCHFTSLTSQHTLYENGEIHKHLQFMLQGEARFSLQNEVNRVLTPHIISRVRRRMQSFPWSRDDQKLNHQDSWDTYSAKQMVTFSRAIPILFANLFPRQRCFCRSSIPLPLPEHVRLLFNLQVTHTVWDHWKALQEVDL